MDARVLRILERLKELFVRALGNDLTGIYVHGSLAFGCFTWETGDIDLIIVAEREPGHEIKREIIRNIIQIEKDAPRKGIELSVLLKDDLRHFAHPMPYVLHYSKAHTEQYLRDMDGHIRRLKGNDRDLAAHLTVMHAVGYPFAGPPVKEVFPEVSKGDYLDSIWFDIENAQEEICGEPVYMVLNLLRVAAFLEDGRVLSKAGGGAWGRDHLPAEYTAIAEEALAYYRMGTDTMEVFEASVLRRYAEYMLNRIRCAMPETVQEEV